MVTAVASERRIGIEPTLPPWVRPDRPLRLNAWTEATLACEPPPNTRARPPATATAASCTGDASAPTYRVWPVAVRMARTLFVVAPLADSPPRTISECPEPAVTTSRLIGL